MTMMGYAQGTKAALGTGIFAGEVIFELNLKK